MAWKKVKTLLGGAAPILGGLFGGPAGAVAGQMVGAALGVSGDNPAEIAQALMDPEAVERIRRLEAENRIELQRLLLEAESVRLTEINKTMRAETASSDPYVRRWRPTFGYSIAITWILQTLGIMAALIYAVIWSPGQASSIITAVSMAINALGMQWAVALAVLGINVTSRSRDKQIAAGQSPDPGIAGQLLDIFKRHK